MNHEELAFANGAALSTDVARIHDALRRLGYTVAADESAPRVVGPSTREALAAFQRDHGLEPTGDIDAESEALLQPAAALARRLSRAAGSIPRHAEIARFLEAHPAFDLDRTPVEVYLQQTRERSLAAAGGAPAEDTTPVNELKSLQRVFRITPRFDEIRPLLAQGLDSAHKIASTGEHTFVARFASDLGGEARAREIFNRAAQASARTQAVLMKYLELTRAAAPAAVQRRDVLPPALARSGDAAAIAAVTLTTSQLPDLESLFGSLEFCDCEECRSVLSPAAYLVDLLALLARTPATSRRDPGVRWLLDVLFSRRPDIGELELTCENTNVPVPYVDLVNEVLEGAVARYSATDDFSPTANPGGTWSYGYRTTAAAAFTPLTLHADRPAAGLQTWYANGVEPAITRNRTGATADYGGISHPTRALHLHSGPGPSGTIAAVRWTAPADDRVRFVGRFERLQATAVPPAVRVLHNATAILAPSTVPAAGQPFSIVRAVRAGDTIEFAAGGTAPSPDPPTAPQAAGVGLTVTIVPAARQTRGAADDLSASPEYTVPRAYEELSLAVYPPTLPFDLTGTEARTYLERLGITRPDLMDVFIALGEVRPPVNVARASAGASASASATYEGDNPPSAAIDGNRAGNVFPGYWADDTPDVYPDSIQVDFAGPKSIEEISVYTTQDAPLDGTGPAVENPPADLKFAKYGIVDFDVQYSAASGWVTVPGGAVVGNDKVWRRFTFPPIATNKIRVVVKRAAGRLSRITEIEAYEAGTRVNVARKTAGGSATASSVSRPWPPAMAIDGDRIGRHWKGQTTYPVSFQVAFPGAKRINQIDLFLGQDGTQVDPLTTPGLTSRYANRDFSVQYRTGTTWTTVPGGVVTGNDRVWRRFTFPTVSTDQIRVVITRGPITGDVPAIVELEAYEAPLTELDLATERLGLTSIARQIITDAPVPSAPTAWEFWGYPSEQVVDPIRPVEGQTVAWNTALSHVPELMHRGGLSFTEVAGLLEVGWVNPNGRMVFQAQGQPNPVSEDLRQLDVANTDVNAFLRMRRFLRLWRALGFTMRETDAALRAFVATDLDTSLLIRLSHVQHLRDWLRVPVLEMVAWWGRLDTRAYDTPGLPSTLSLYEQVFQSQAVRALTSGAADPFALNAARTELATIGTISANLPAIGAALQLSAADLALLANPAAADLALRLPSEITNDRLDLANLSHLYRIASFARALRLSIREFMLLKAWAGINPFDRTDDTLRFITALQKSKAAGLDSAELDYIFRHVTSPGTNVAPTDADLARVLGEIRDGMDQLRKGQRANFIKQKLAQMTGLDVAVMDRLLVTWLPSRQDPAARAMSDYLALAGTTNAITRSAFPAQFASLTLLLKIARLLGPLNLTLRAFTWIFQRGTEVGWLDPRTLPVAPAASAQALHAGWIRLLEFLRLRATLGDEVPFDLLDRFTAPQPDVNAALTEISRLTGWNRDDVRFLLAGPGAAIQFPIASADRVLVAVAAAVEQAGRSGASAAMLRQWAVETSPAAASGIRQALKARYGEDQWASVAKPLRDTLRARQRSALVDYLIVNPALLGLRHVPDANALYEHFLLDVEMGPCLMTSRITQAIGSVQLFVQRSLMRMEHDVVLNQNVAADLSVQWDWMKNYRLWEANRRIFLHPENWIRPELRDDKSPFFKELEDELLQSDVTMETAEEAFRHYLEKLDAVAHLEVCAVWPERNAANEVVVLHVFARTWNTPHAYYYRTWRDHEWTAWEKIDLDIEGDHLLAAVHDQRLYLFWAMFAERTSSAAANAPLVKEWEVKIAWSERRHGRWSAKQVSPAPIVYSNTTGTNALPPKDRFGLKTLRDGTLSVVVEWDDVAATVLLGPEGAASRETSTGDTVLPAVAFERSASLASISTDGRDPIPEPIDEPTISVEPTRADRGQTFTIYGDFFRRNANVTVKVRKPNTVEEQFSATTNDQGSFWISYPTDANASQVGRYSVRLGTVEVGRFDVTAPLIFTVSETVLVNDAVTMTATGLGPAAAVTFSIVGVADVAATANEAGTATASRPMPAPGTFTVRLIEAGKTRAERTFTVNARPVPETLRETRPIGRFILGDARGPMRVVNGGQGLAAARVPRHTVLSSTAFAEVGEREFSLFTIDPPGAPAQVVPVLARTPGRFRLVPARDAAQVSIPLPFFYQDEARAYHVTSAADGYRFVPFYHPFVDRFVRELNARGVDGLLQRSVQSACGEPTAFPTAYGPYNVVSRQYPLEEVAFDASHAYATYNWELFFHAPLLIANRLSQNQRHAEAQQWFHYIFDPLDNSSASAPAKYWRTRPLYEATDQGRVQDELQRLFSDDAELDAQVARWRQNPFSPHAIARLRASAYPKTVVMRYIDNLIAWGDQLFHRDTMESINEATQLYMLAAAILGPRPQAVPARSRPPVKTFSELAPALDAFSNALVQIESTLAHVDGNGTAPSAPGAQAVSTLLAQTLYFTIPANDKLAGYWDTVADRLFKIRHCMTIEGVARRLPLFEARIDPALLVRAQAAGVDLGSALSAIDPPLPRYHYQTMAQKASELCADVRSLGAALLSAIEKRDGEALALLRSTHEIQVLQAVRLTKEAQIAEAEQALDGLRKSRGVVVIRHQHYKSIEFMNPWEVAHLTLSSAALLTHGIGAGLHMAAGAVKTAAPQATAGVTGALPTLLAEYGGTQVGGGLESWATGFKEASAIIGMGAGISATVGSHWRRWDEWKLQEKLAAAELAQIDKQIAAAEIRLAIATQDLKNHDRQVANAQAIDAYMRDKFSNRDLYDWMVGQIAAVYFQSYQLAYDAARRAEKAFAYDIGLGGVNFIDPRYWDSLKKGLLAGERLQFDLQRMNVAYLDQHQRQFEITRHISLSMLDPAKLLQLKTTGVCEIDVPESLFDFDYPGHFMRRIKSVSLTMPAVTGPYTSLNCTLTLLKNRVRKDTSVTPAYPCTGPTDPRFFHDMAAIESIVTSHGQNDSGVFEVSFRDDRYLPCEGAGVDSRWRIELPLDCNQFDLNTISDVILHVKYTARDGGPALRAAAINARPKTGARLFSIRHEFPTEWARFKSTQIGAGTPAARLSVDLQDVHYPFWTQGRPKTVTQARLFAKTTRPQVEVTENADGTGRKDVLVDDDSMGDLRAGAFTNLPRPAATGRLNLYLNDASLDDLYLLVAWTTA